MLYQYFQFELQTIHHMDIIQNLVKSKVTGIESFEYLIMPKMTLDVKLNEIYDK